MYLQYDTSDNYCPSYTGVETIIRVNNIAFQCKYSVFHIMCHYILSEPCTLPGELLRRIGWICSGGGKQRQVPVLERHKAFAIKLMQTQRYSTHSKYAKIQQVSSPTPCGERVGVDLLTHTGLVSGDAATDRRYQRD